MQMNKFTLEEIQLGLEIYEKYLIQEAYLSNDIQTLHEIKLSFKGIKDLGKRALAKFKSLATPEKTFVGLLGKLKKQTGKEAKEILSFIRDKAKEYEGKSLKDIQKDIEKLYNEFTGNKVDEALSDTARRIGGTLALILYAALSLAPSAFASADALGGLDNSPTIENPVDLEGDNDDPNTISFADAQELVGPSLGSDIAFDSVKTGISSQGVNVDVGDTGGVISFNTGEFNASQADINAAAQAAVDDLVDSLDGKDLTKVDLDPFGLISNTPGDQDNNPSGSGTDGLDAKRLDTAKKIADKAADLLKDKFPDADIQVSDGTTNSSGVDSQKQVDKGSAESASTQVAGFSFSGVETGDADTGDEGSPEVAKARLIDPKVELDNRSRYLAILTLFLPLLVDDYDELADNIVKSTGLTESDFPLGESRMFKKLKELEKKEDKTPEDEEVIKALKWSVGTSKSPSTLLRNINKLDPKVALGKRVLRKSLRPGVRGKSMGRSGFPGISQGSLGTSPTDPRNPNTGDGSPGSRADRGFGGNVGPTVGESLMSILLEAQTDFSELPKYNSSKAKSNLGMLVPLYAAFWASEPGRTADGQTLPTGFNIDYVIEKYSSSWETFTQKFPVVAGIVTSPDLVDYEPGKEPKAQDTGDTKDKDSTTPQKPTGPIDLSAINTKAELKFLILSILKLTNQDFASQDTSIKRYMFTLANQVKSLKEEADLDVSKISKILTSSAIRNKILKISNKDDLKALIVNDILPSIDPELRNNLKAVKGALIGAANSYKYDASELDEMSKKKIRQRDKLAKSIKPRTIKQYGKKEGESAAYAIATNMVKEDCGCGCGGGVCGNSTSNSIIEQLIEDLVYEELCKRGKAYIAARKRAGEKSSAYLSGRAVKVCKGQIKGAGGKRKKSYRNESLYNQLKPQVLKYLEETLFNDPHFAIVSEYNVEEANIDESLRNWFKKENWVRIDTQGNIAGKCGTMPKGKATQRCLPRAKAMSLTKAQRRATARKKVRGSKKGKQFVRNTKKARVSFKKK